MSNPSRDLYEVLGVSRSATPDEIKKAYRAKARTLHPDVNKSEGASLLFAEVQHAYDILSDQEKRKKYDRFGHDARPDVFSATAAAMDPEDLGAMFDAFFGAKGGPGRTRPARRGRDLQREVELSFLTAIRGGTESIRIDTGSGVRTIDLKVPAGVQEGARLRVRGGGAPGLGQGDPGDLIVTVRIGRHPLYRRVENSSMDLELDLPLSVGEATLGATIDVPTPDGKRVSLRIPPGTSTGAKLRIRGHGVRPSTGQPGDLLALVEVVVPDPALLSEQERALLSGLTAKSPQIAQRFVQ